MKKRIATFVLVIALVGLVEFLVLCIIALHFFKEIGQSVWMMDFNPLTLFVIVFLVLGLMTTFLVRWLLRRLKSWDAGK